MGWVGTAGTWPPEDRHECHFKWPDAKLLAVQARVVFYTLCFPESVAIAPHWSALLTLLMRSLDTCRVYTTHPLSSCCLPCMGTLHLVQISRIFLVKLSAACEELVAWKRRSGKSAVIPRQKWQPHVTARLRCAAARCLRTNTEAFFLPGQTDTGDASPGWYVVQGSSCLPDGDF